MAAPEYTYVRFLRAIGKFPAFCGEYTDGRDSDAICKKSIVTAFAHFSQETGGHIAKENVSDNPLGLEEWQQALVHVREMGWSAGTDRLYHRLWPERLAEQEVALQHGSGVFRPRRQAAFLPLQLRCLLRGDV